MYNIDTLARLTGLSRRTIRYYVQRGVLPPPAGGGRGSYYTEEHLEKLRQIREWSDQGVPLGQMKAMLEGKLEQFKLDTESAVQVTLWERFKLYEGIELHYSPGSLSHAELLATRDWISNLKHLNQGPFEKKI